MTKFKGWKTSKRISQFKHAFSQHNLFLKLYLGQYLFKTSFLFNITSLQFGNLIQYNICNYLISFFCKVCMNRVTWQRLIHFGSYNELSKGILLVFLMHHQKRRKFIFWNGMKIIWSINPGRRKECKYAIERYFDCIHYQLMKC